MMLNKVYVTNTGHYTVLYTDPDAAVEPNS